MKKIIILLCLCTIIYACDSGSNNQAQDGVFDEQQDQNTQDNQNSQNNNNLDNDSQEFIKNAASSSMLEVQLGELASNKAQNQQVKEYAQMLVEEHKNANDNLKNIAQQQNVNLPQNLKEDHKNKLEELKNASDQEFDKKYMDMVINLHENDISKFEDKQNDIKNQELKGWVNQTLPKLRDHLQRAEQINQNVQQ